MKTDNLRNNVIVVDLPLREPEIAERLQQLNEQTSSNPDRDVIVNFANVELITSSSISNLLILLSTLAEAGHRLILCNVSVPTKCIFSVAGLAEVFEFLPDKPTALAALQTTS